MTPTTYNTKQISQEITTLAMCVAMCFLITSHYSLNKSLKTISPLLCDSLISGHFAHLDDLPQEVKKMCHSQISYIKKAQEPEEVEKFIRTADPFYNRELATIKIIKKP